jgi:MFS family permease
MNGTVETIPSTKENDHSANKPSALNGCTLGGVTIGNPTHRKALLFSLWDGIFANGMAALVDTFAVAAAVYLNTPALTIAFLSSIPLLLGSVGQLFMPYFFNPSKGRKKYVVNGCTVQSLSLLLLGCSGWLPPALKPWAFVIFFAIYGFSGNIVSSLWITWMGDLVPLDARGRHFAWRNRFFSLTQLSCALLAGFALRKYSAETADWFLFAVVFFTASIFRWVSAQILHFQYEPPVTNKTPIRFHKSDLVVLRPFLFFCCTAGLMQGAAALSGPFFNVWFVRDLHFNFLSLSAAAAATVLGSILSLSIWGRLCDTIGNRRVLYFTGLLVSLVPFPYIFFANHGRFAFSICTRGSAGVATT